MTRLHIPRTTTWGLRLALATAVVSGVSVWLNGYAVKQVPDPALYTTLKNLVAAVILICAALSMGGATEALSLGRRTWARLLFIGLIGGSVPFLLFFGGLAQATAPGAAFIHKTLVIWVALLAVPLLGERLGLAQIGALAILLVGQLLLVPPKIDGVTWGIGETMILAATLLWSVEVVIARRLLGRQLVTPSVAGAARMGLGVVLLIIFVGATGGLGGVGSLTAEAWGWVLLTGVCLAAYVGTWYSALRRAPASAVTAVLVVGAVVTSGLQAVSNGLAPSTQTIGGAALLLAATVLIVASVRHGPRRIAAPA